MDIFRRFLRGSEEKLEGEDSVNASSMREPNTPHSGRSSEAVIEILSSDDEDGNESVASRLSAGKPAAVESVTATDSSNDFDGEGEEGKENSGTRKIIDNASSDVSKAEADESSLGKPAEIVASNSPVESSKLVIRTMKLHSARKRRRKRARLSHSDSPSALQTSSNLRRKRKKDRSKKSTSPRRIVSNRQSVSPSQIQNEEDPFDFPSEEQFNIEQREAQAESYPDEQPSAQDMKAINEGQVENIDKAQNPLTSNAPLDTSPSKMIPEFRLPPELAPFNNPGVCDYGVIRTSRLRNRKKAKTVFQEDVPYQNIQGQRRCRATQDGKRMAGEGNDNRCKFCAEGTFKYCHKHRDLCPEQKIYWEKRKQRDERIGSSSSSVRTNAVVKKPPAKPQSSASSVAIRRSRNITIAESQMICVEAGEAEANNTRRCVVLCQGKGRCARKMMATHPGFCYGHRTFAQSLERKKDDTFKGHAGTLRCTAISKVGSKCKFKAIPNCVFCNKHVASPPETATPVMFITDPGNKKDDGGTVSSIGVSSRKRGPNCNMSLATKQSKRVKSLVSNIIGKAKGNLMVANDEVPKNIEFPRKLAFSKEDLEKATSFDEMCFNVYKQKRCIYKRAEGGVLCHMCLMCHEDGTPFEHILDSDTKIDESILHSTRCVKFEGNKQCQNMAFEGKLLCEDCTKVMGDSEVSESDSDNVSTTTYSSCSESSQESVGSDETNYDAYCKAYTHKQFFDMWRNWEKKTEKMDEVEDSRLIKRANNTMDPTDTDGQVKAQYGRVLPHAMKKMIKILELGREDVFLDIGHGVGNTCLHASFCTGCDSRGIEVVSDRHEIADKFRGGMYAEHNCTDEPRPEVGKVELRLGRLEDPQQKDFLTKGITRAYVNNFNGVFAERSSKNKDKWFLDDYISGIFASMAPGAIMVTFHPLNLGLDRASTNSLRNKHNLEESDHASYYDSEKILLGQAFCTVKWNKRSGNTNKIFVYKYRRLHQPGHHDAVFLCSNPSCKMATDMVPIPATTINEDGRCVINHCECKFSPKNLRKRDKNKASP